MASKDVWQAVKSHNGGKTKYPLNSLLSNYDSIEEGAEAINESLRSVSLKSDQSSPMSVLSTSTELWNVNINSKEVLNRILKTKKGKSSADFPILIYHHIAQVISTPLCELYKASIQSSSVPQAWKSAAITTVLKTASPTLDDLRPISILPLPGKILESIVLSSLKNKLIDCYGDNQFGFRSGSSTLCALVSLHEKLTSYLDRKDTCGALIISYDYSKAFDRLKSELILKRLHECNFPSSFISWISDYLQNRTQFVRIGAASSSSVEVTSGVPQGSVVGPHFAIATSILKVDESKCHMVKYADDISLCFPLFKNSANQHINSEHERLVRWSDEIDFKLNGKKCKSLVVGKRGHATSFHLPGVTSVDKLSILGVTFNEKGSWSSHCDGIIKQSSRRFYALRILRRSLSDSAPKLTYYSLVRSLLEYCIPLPMPLSANDSFRLDRVQRRFHRLLCNDLCSYDCLPDLRKRRETLCLRFIKSAMSPDHILHGQLPSRSTTGRFILPQRRTAMRSRTFILYACSLYNNTFTR